MNWKQILTAGGIAIGAAVGGFYAAPESEMDAAISGIQTVTDTLTPEHYSHYMRDTTYDDSTWQIPDSVLVEARYNPISVRINNNRVFNIGDTIIYIAIEKKANSTSVFGLRHIVGKDGVRYISKYDEVF